MPKQISDTVIRLKAKMKRILGRIIPNQVIIWQANPEHKIVAITFDDGPDPIYTSQIIDALEQVNGKGTFFLVGKNVERYPEIARKIIDRGHEVGCHSFSHDHALKVGITNMHHEITSTIQLLEKTLDQSISLFRPPFGILNINLMTYCWRHDLTIAMWSLDSRDHEAKHIIDIKKKASSDKINPGDILLFHDNNDLTVHFLREQLPALALEGYSFVTVSGLINSKQTDNITNDS